MVELTTAAAAAALLRENRTSEGDSSTVATTSVGPSDWDWWSDEDSGAPMPLDGREGGLWSGVFVPPPPRPLFLDEAATPDGPTTCDLCSWAWQGQGRRTPYHRVDAATEAPGELGWVLTLIIVSIISAAIGAVIMITALHCKSRMKNGASTDSTQRSASSGASPERRISLRPPISTPSDGEDKEPGSEPYPAAVGAREAANNGVWSWLTSRRSAVPAQLTPSPGLPAENHYTHMDENYSSVGEALYAELDRDSNSPAYQNSAYTDPDAPTSSAPSSAYYSDLSVTTVPDRAYEVVGVNTTSCYDGGSIDLAIRRPPRLAAISETVTMPSDYV